MRGSRETGEPLRFGDMEGARVSKYLTGLVCRECEASYQAEPRSACDECFGPLEPTYDLERIRAEAARPGAGTEPRSLWRYEALLPTQRDELVDRVQPGPDRVCDGGRSHKG